MKRILQLTACLLLTIGAKSQTFVKPLAIQQGTDCNNIAVVSMTNGPVAAQLWNITYDNVLGTEFEAVGEGDTLFTFCLAEEVSAMIRNQVVLTRPNSYDTLASSTLVLPKFNYEITQYTAPSSSYANDGSITLTFDSLVESYIFMAFDAAGELAPVTTDNHTYEFSNMSTGVFGFSIMNDPFDPSANFYVTAYIGDPNQVIYNNEMLQVEVSSSYVALDCDGMISVVPLDAYGDVTYEWSIPDAGNVSAMDSLCPGIYSVFIYDQANNSATRHFLITDYYQSFYDDNFGNLIPQDTVNMVFESCSFDFNTPVDSVNYFENLIAENAGIQTIVFDIMVYQAGNMVVFSDTIVVASDSVILVDCGIYCETLKSTFNNKRIVLVRGGNQTAGVTELNNLSVHIFPNPAEDQMTIEGVDAKGYITDASGRTVQFITSKNVDLSALKSGMYLVHLEHTAAAFKLLKK